MFIIENKMHGCSQSCCNKIWNNNVQCFCNCKPTNITKFKKSRKFILQISI